MAFSILVLHAKKQGHGQFLLRSLGQKDTYGTNRFIPFAKLWDVAHWNSHYPALPRLVDYDPILHSQFNLYNRAPSEGRVLAREMVPMREIVRLRRRTPGRFARA